MEYLVATRRESFCEWKGVASYWSVRVGDKMVADAAWSYASPNGAFRDLKDCLAFYPGFVECSIDGERAQPQPGGFYGGWITKDVVGPFKGIAGSWGW